MEDGPSEGPRSGGTLVRIGAIALLCLIPFAWAQVLWHMYLPAAVVQHAGDRYVIVAVNSRAAQQAGVRVGDRVNLDGLSAGDRYLLVLGSLTRPVQYPLVREGRVQPVTLSDERVRWPATWYTALDDIATVLVGTISLLVAAILLWRRPSALTFAFALYALGAVPAYTIIELFARAPSPVLSAVIAVVFVVFGPLPQFALLYFAVRFPRTPSSPQGRLALHGATALALGAIVLYLFRYSRPDAAIDPADVLRDLLPQFAAVVLATAVAAVRFTRSTGADRRRIGWVLLGMVVSGASYCVVGFDQDFVNIGFPMPHWIGPIAALGYGVFPLTLTYAVLRHRVIDVGFALNRTLVYTLLTLTVVIVVSVVDWLSGKLISNSNLSLAIEAVVTIALGVGLNALHTRVEHLVDRVVFRKRHLAAQRLELRIRALDFATSPGAVESALVDDVVSVLELRSAALFHRAAGSSFMRVRALGWDGCTDRIEADSLLARALTAEERAVFLDEQGIREPAFPKGAARPDVAIPLIVRHELIGCALYGHRDGEGVVDPEERSLLERLARVAASAYDAIEAAEWRRRALAAEERTSMPLG
jgi:GAF domain